MAILARMITAGMHPSDYDDMSGYLGEQIKKQPGFMIQVAYPGPSGLLVEEIWDSKSQFETWFSQSVKPNVPDVQVEVIQLHAVVLP